MVTVGDVLPMARTDHQAQDLKKMMPIGVGTLSKKCILSQKSILHTASFSPPDITGIAVDGPSGTMVLTDKKLQPLT